MSGVGGPAGLSGSGLFAYGRSGLILRIWRRRLKNSSTRAVAMKTVTSRAVQPGLTMLGSISNNTSAALMPTTSATSRSDPSHSDFTRRDLVHRHRDPGEQVVLRHVSVHVAGDQLVVLGRPDLLVHV